MLVRVTLVLLVGLGLLGLVGAFLLSQQQPPPAAPPVIAAPVSAHIIVTARAVRAGSLVVPEDLEAAAIDQDKMLPGSIRDTPEARQHLRGAMMRRSLAAGEPFMPGDYLSPGDRGFLAAVLDPGMRAVAIGVDAVSGTAGLIWPGDRVDLLLTQSIDDQSLPSDHRLAGETLLDDVRVIAVDQQLVQGAQAGGNGQGGGNRTVTLEVSPVDAERIEVAARLGRLSLAVHPAAQPSPSSDELAVHPEAPEPVFAGDVSAALRVHGAAKAAGPAVKVYRGAGDPVEYRF
jgi:pilus assembly protein CpaB